MSVGRTRNHLIDAAAFILLEVAALAMISYNAELQRTWLAKGANSITAAVWGVVEDINQDRNLRQENKLLADENQFLQQQIEAYKTQSLAQYPTFSSMQPAHPNEWQYMQAEIVKHQFKGQHSYYILNRGEQAGVRVGNGVITPRGVVGVVDAVSKHYSYVRSFFNAGMTVVARVDSVGVVGPLVWEGLSYKKATLRSIPHHIPVPEGSVLYSSSFSGAFPSDIPLGECGKSTLSSDGTQNVEVRLYEDPYYLRYVTIVSKIWQDEIEQLENE